MIYEYFERTEADAAFYDERLINRLPENIIDAHNHVNLPEHVSGVPKERILSDWAMQCGFQITAEDAAHYAATLFPRRKVSLAAFPFPAREAALEENNGYIAACVREGKLAYGLMCVKPEYSNEYIEEQVHKMGFSGLKPYPDMVSGVKGADISIFDFLPRRQIALAERLKLPIVLHLPRAGRMADAKNTAELRDIRQSYPDSAIIIAHFGRCYTRRLFGDALEKLGEDAGGFWFDTAGVVNPEVYSLAFSSISAKRILYGTDQPIFLWHGYREWTQNTYTNIAREDFPWNKNRRAAEEANCTFFVYRQLDNLLNELERRRADKEALNDIFYNNAERLFSREKSGA